MTMTIPTASRRTTADIIFEQLRDQIMALELLPGAKMSEAEIAAKFGVSRQPVREAFNLLGNLDLLVIQPQKATRVQRFSMSKIQNARFVRLAIEIEMAKTACANWSDVYRPGFQRNLEAQNRAVASADTNAFHTLDEEFHGMIADVARTPLAFEQILRNKAHVNRICVLSLKEADEMKLLVGDHAEIFEGMAERDPERVEQAVRRHLSRIDKTIATVQASHASFFVP